MPPNDTDTDQETPEENTPEEEAPASGPESGEILSDEENEALRESHASDGNDENSPTPEGRVKDLHADHWERIIAGRIPALESINARMCTLLETTTRQFLRMSSDVTVHPTVMRAWGPYAEKLTIPTNLNTINIKPFNVRGAIRLDSGFVFALCDLFFGGDGAGDHVVHQVEFTPMELQLARRYTALIAADLKEAWQPFIDLEFTPGASESNPMFASIAKRGDLMAITAFTVKLHDRECQMDIMLPDTLLEPIRYARDAGHADLAKSEGAQWNRRIRQDIKSANISLRAVLTETEITLRDLTNAKPGDVISTDIPSSVTLLVGEQAVLEGTFGVKKGFNAVKVNSPINTNALGDNNGRA